MKEINWKRPKLSLMSPSLDPTPSSPALILSPLCLAGTYIVAWIGYSKKKNRTQLTVKQFPTQHKKLYKNLFIFLHTNQFTYSIKISPKNGIKNMLEEKT
jgi:hypothetical protein